MPKSDNRKSLEQLFRRLCNDFGDASGMVIIQTIVSELGGQRISVPDFHDLYRLERNRKICDKFNGINHRELAITFGMSVAQVRRVLDEHRTHIKQSMDDDII